MSARRPRRVLFAGGGTGGHLFPGIALARHLGGKVFFLCTERPFDRAELEKEGLPFEVLPSPRLSPQFPLRFGRACAQAARRVLDFRPDVVVGLGGYGMVPPVTTALTLGIPFVLLEQNVIPGRANRALAPLAARIYAQWEDSRRYLRGRVVVSGSPLRPSLRRIPRAEAHARFGTDPSRPTVLVVGGSQGAGALNALAIGAQSIRLTGRGGRAEGTVVLEFLNEMEYAYSASDLVISRAGAMAIAEITWFGIPAVLVPYPQATNDHQRANARALGDAAWVVEETGLERVGEVVARLVSGDPIFDNKRRALQRFARPEAARVIEEDLATL